MTETFITYDRQNTPHVIQNHPVDNIEYNSVYNVDLLPSIFS